MKGFLVMVEFDGFLGVEVSGENEEAARKNVVENYNVDTIVKEKWLPYLENLQLELLGPIDTKTEK